MTSEMRECEKVIIPPNFPNLGVGYVVKELTPEGITFARPFPCVITFGTEKIIRSGKTPKIVKELNEEYVVEFDGNKYIFNKKIWDLGYNYTVKMGRGLILFYGTRGTGKSSLMSIIAESLGYSYFLLTQDKVKSRYYGETENKFVDFFNKAIKEQPSIVLVDEADWLISARKFDSSNIVDSTRDNLIDIFLQIVQEEIMNKDNAVLIIMTTNAKPEYLDSAVLDRTKLQLAFPLPSYEAIEEMLTKDQYVYKGRTLTKREASKFLMNVGASWRGVKKFNDNPDSFSVQKDTERMRRAVSELPVRQNDLDTVKKLFEKLSVCNMNKLLVVGYQLVNVALLGVLLTEECKRAVFIFTSESSPKEIKDIAEFYNGVIFVDIDVLHDPKSLSALLDPDISVFFFSNGLNGDVYRIVSNYSNLIDVRGLFANREAKYMEALYRLVLDFYGIKTNYTDFNRLVNALKLYLPNMQFIDTTMKATYNADEIDNLMRLLKNAISSFSHSGAIPLN